MNPVKKANILFQSGSFREALDLYREAADRYGYKYLGSNIELCKKRVNAGKSISDDHFEYPLSKPSVAVLITGKENLKYYPKFSLARNLPFNLRIYFNTSDGIRPLHDIELLDLPENILYPLDRETVALPESDFAVTLAEDEILSEKDLVKFIEYKTGIRDNNPTPLVEIKVQRNRVIPGRVSVIIPTYKRPKNLRNALMSVLEQDYKDIEIIVISDNGLDSEYNAETREIVNALKDTSDHCEVILLEHSVNRNGAAARNTGILYSSGEYICFLDDDDIYLPGRLSKSIEVLISKKKTVGAVYCGYLWRNSTETNPDRFKPGNLTREILLMEYDSHYLHTTTATYRREAVLNLNGFDETYGRHQDLEFNLRFFDQYGMGVVEEALVRLRLELTDVCNQVFDMDLLHLKSKFLSRFKYLIESFPPDAQKDIYAAHHDSAFRQNSKKDEAVEYYKNRFHDYSAQALFGLLGKDK